MSFLQKARDAANQMADQAKATVDTVAVKATDKDTHAKVRQQMTSGMGIARRGMKSVIDRIDPGTLAEVVIKATAIQELANRALRDKGSPYRISEITITATIPPGVNFTIGRVVDLDELTGGEVTSTELVTSEDGNPILSLSGATDLEEALAEADAGAPLHDAAPGSEPDVTPPGGTGGGPA